MKFFFHQLNIGAVGFLCIKILHFHGIFLEIEEFPGVEGIVRKANQLLFAIRYPIVNGDPVSTCFIVMIVMCLSPVFWRSLPFKMRK